MIQVMGILRSILKKKTTSFFIFIVIFEAFSDTKLTRNYD